MKIDDLRKVNNLVATRDKMLNCMRELNELNGKDAEFRSIPPEVLGFVDQREAAKGLLSLLIPAIAEVETRLTNLGVDW